MPAGHQALTWSNSFVCAQPKPSAAIRLFCFHHAGAGASSFFPWYSELENQPIELWCAQLPGRENRIGQAPLRNIDQVTEMLCQAMQSLLSKPFAFFGHSMGSLISFELFRCLRRKGLPRPVHLFISSAPPPEDGFAPERGLCQLADEPLLVALENLYGNFSISLRQEPELARIILPVLRADLQLLAGYTFFPDIPADCPITVLYGAADSSLPPNQLRLWAHHTIQRFEAVAFTGDHFYLNSNRPAVIARVLADLGHRYVPGGQCPRPNPLIPFAVRPACQTAAKPGVFPAPAALDYKLILLSAKTSDALEAMTSNLAAFLESRPDLDLDSVAHTLQTGRESFNWRRVVLGRERDQLIQDLKARNPQTLSTASSGSKQPRIAFLIAGLGEQYPGMGGQLYESEPVFRLQIDRCAEVLKPILGRDLRPVMLAGQQTAQPPGERLILARETSRAQDWSEDESTAIMQPAQFILNYALAALWISKGIRPEALFGYSLGEYVAATIAGVFDLEDALKLVAQRAALIEGLPRGSMLAVALSAESLRTASREGLSVAAITSAGTSILSGPEDAMQQFKSYLISQGVAWRPLRTRHAVHSRMMEPIQARLAQFVGSVRRRSPEIPFISNVSGHWITAAEAASPAYWANHLCRPVLFSQGIRVLCDSGSTVMLELGPNSSLSRMAIFALQEDSASRIQWIPSLCSDSRRERHSILQAVARLWLAGAEISWKHFYPTQPPRVPLPGYPFLNGETKDKQYG